MVQDFCGLQGDERWCGGVGGGFGWSTVSKWSGERSRGSREGLHDPPIGGWVRQGFGWSRQKLVCSMVMSCRSESKLICRKHKQNREYIKIGNTH